MRPRNKPWFTRDVRLSVRNKTRLFRKYKRSPTVDKWLRYKRARNNCVLVSRKAKEDYDRKIELKFLDPLLSVKKFWSITKSVYGDSRIMSIPSLEENGVDISDNLRKATGPDGIANRVLKETATSISKPLYLLFQYCFERCYFPTVWKTAHGKQI